MQTIHLTSCFFFVFFNILPQKLQAKLDLFMQASNKFKTPQNSISLENAEFQKFIQTIKDQRSIRPKSLNKSEVSKSQHPSSKHSSQMLRDLESLGSTSLYFHKNHNKQHPSQKYGGDAAIKNKDKYGVALRSTMKQYQFPSQYFTPTKRKIQQHLKDSMFVPNVQVFPKVATNSSGKKQLFSQNQISLLTESKVLRGDNTSLRFSKIDPNIVLKYCLIHRLTQDSNIKEILIFFVRLLELLNYTIPEPNIQKYRDCIYFGVGLKKRQITEGLLYFFEGSVYIGQILDYSMHGRGTQIFFNSAAIYKGDFKEGRMYGYFQITKDQQKYCGMVQNGLYHGHGKLITQRSTVQGEFREGKLINMCKSSPKQQSNKNSSFRVRGNFRPFRQGTSSAQIQTVDQMKSSKTDFHNHEKEVYYEFPSQRNSSGKNQKSFNEIIQYDSALSSQMIQEGTQQYNRASKKASYNNPENSPNLKQSYFGKQRQVGHFTKPMRTIRQQTDFGQEQPLFIDKTIDNQVRADRSQPPFIKS